MFSQAVYSDPNVLLENPDLIGQDGYAAFGSALWFYMMPQSPKPSMHEVSTNLYVPNAYDVSRDLGATFGATTLIINGGLECSKGGEENENSQKRASHYVAFLNYFGLPEETEASLGCADMQPFASESSSSYPMSLDMNWAITDSCKVAPWFTGFSIFNEDDYKRCVCWAIDPDNFTECLEGMMEEDDKEILTKNEDLKIEIN